MVEQHFCLRWNNYRTNITAEFEVLRDGEHFVDVTLACDGHQLKAHKVVLSACSPYFKDLLQGNPCSHPIIILRDVGYIHMRGLLQFMYAGEVNVSQAQLAAFLRTAEALKVRGLAEAPENNENSSSSIHSAAAAAAAAAVTNSVADLFKTSMNNLPFVPLAAAAAAAAHQHQRHGSGAPPVVLPVNNSKILRLQGNVSSCHLSTQIGSEENTCSFPPVSSDHGGVSASTILNSSSCIDKSLCRLDSMAIKTSDAKLVLFEEEKSKTEPLSLKIDNSSKESRELSPSHQRSKRFKYSQCEVADSPSPHSASSFYLHNAESNGSPIATDECGTDELVQDLSSSARPRENEETPVTGSASGRTLPSFLCPSSPDHPQMVLKSELPDSCGGSDSEAAGAGWHGDDSSDNELMFPSTASTGKDDDVGNASVRGNDTLLHGQISQYSENNAVSSATSLGNVGTSSVGASISSSVTTVQQKHSRASSTPPPSNLLHPSVPAQDSHLTGIMRVFEPLPCPICKRSYSSPGNLKQHIENIHMATNQPSYECSICSNRFKSKWYLHKHLHRAHHIRGRKEPMSTLPSQPSTSSKI